MKSLIFDRALLRQRQGRAASGIARHDFLIERASDEILSRLEAVNRPFPLAANIGAHHGLLSRAMAGHPAISVTVSAEAAPQLLRLCPPPRVAADAEALPFANESLDLAASALSLQFVNDLPGALVQIRRALRPDGLFLGALVGGETLKELREAFLLAEIETGGGASPRVAPMADVRDLGALLQRAGFALPVADSDRLKVTYADAFALMRDLRGMGAGNALIDRPRTPLRRRTLLRAAEIYQERFPAGDGRIEATFEIIYLTGWAPHESQQKPLAPGSAKARLADALGVPERPGGAKAAPQKANNE